MDKYVCAVCGYDMIQQVGDPDDGIAPGTKFKDIPDDWVCPLCGVPKSDFEKCNKISYLYINLNVG